jgi:hypothetical protein
VSNEPLVTRRGKRVGGFTAGELLYGRMLRARRLHCGQEHDALVAELCQAVARGLGRVIDRARPGTDGLPARPSGSERGASYTPSDKQLERPKRPTAGPGADNIVKRG